MVDQLLRQRWTIACVFVFFILGFVSTPEPVCAKSNIPEEERTALKAAIEDLIDTFGNRYPNGDKYLAKLRSIKRDDHSGFLKLQREALVANPLVSGQPILFIMR